MVVDKDRCRACGKVLQAERVTRRYCNGACRQRDYRGRRKAAIRERRRLSAV